MASARFAFGRRGRYLGDMVDPHTVMALRSEVRRPLTAMLVLGALVAVPLVFLAQSPWFVAFAAGVVVGCAWLLAWLNWPRKGELMRLVLDRPRKTLYWAHRGGEPEELPFPAVRAVAIESTEHPRYVRLWAVDTTGRWVHVGQGTRAELEVFAQEMANVMDVPLWYRDRSRGQKRSTTHATLPPPIR
jgi:hypothetical protein